MTKVISIVNHKGGVGKTTTAINLAAGLSRHGKKVLLMELDAQACCASVFAHLADGVTSADVINGKKAEPLSMNPDASLCFIPGSIELEKITSDMKNARPVMDAIHRLSEEFQYDVIVLDTAPALDMMTMSAMIASDGVIIPVETHYLATKGVERCMGVIDKMKQQQGHPDLFGIVMTKYDARTNIQRTILNHVRKEYAGKMFDTIIRNCVALTEMSLTAMSIFDYAPRSNGAMDYEALTNEVLKKL